MVSANVRREAGGTFVNFGWWNRSGHSGPFIFKTRGIVNEMVRDIGVFRSRSRRWPAAGREEKRKKHSLSFSANPTKHPAGVKKKEENKRVGAKNTERFGTLAQRFTWFGDLHENIEKMATKWRQNGG